MAWTATDLRWLKANYPSLEPTAPGVLEGNLKFRMLHADGLNYIKPNGPMLTAKRASGTYIIDNYSVKVQWKNHSFFPNVYETGGRIEQVAKAKSKDMLDMHIHTSSGSLCLAGTLDLIEAFINKCSLQRYIEEFLIPYLFAQTHYAATGDWLWGELSHDFWGHLELLGRHPNPRLAEIQATFKLIVDRVGPEIAAKLFSVRCRWHHPCPCGSGSRNSDCHPDIKEAINLIRGEISRHKLSLLPKEGV
jgi:hypothetical protein